MGLVVEVKRLRVGLSEIDREKKVGLRKVEEHNCTHSMVRVVTTTPVALR